MIEDLATIASSVRQSAAKLIASQVHVPISPLVRTEDGQVALCAAAALVMARTPDTERATLVDTLEQGGRGALLDMFERFGWSRTLASQVLAANDSLKAEDRKDGVLRLLLAHPRQTITTNQSL